MLKLSKACTAGHGNAEAASAALKALFEEDRPSYRVTLRTTDVREKFVTYEMWRVMDTVTLQTAVLVSTFNATHQRQLEDQLEKAREQLMRSAMTCNCWSTTCSSSRVP